MQFLFLLIQLDAVIDLSLRFIFTLKHEKISLFFLAAIVCDSTAFAQMGIPKIGIDAGIILNRKNIITLSNYKMLIFKEL